MSRLGADGAAALRRLAKGGGRLLADGGSTDFAVQHLALPVRNVLHDVSAHEFFIPGSLLRIRIDRNHALACGMPEETAASFVTRLDSECRTFEFRAPAAAEVHGSFGAVETLPQRHEGGLR